jgi:hypothetical protein
MRPFSAIVPMSGADLATDFREYATGTEISARDWTERSGGKAWDVTADTSSISGRVVQSGSAGNDVFSCTWNRVTGITESTNWQILALIKRSTFASGTPRMCGLTMTTSSGERGVGFGFNLTSEIEVSIYSGGLYITGTQASFTSDTSTFYWLRFTKSSTNYTGKVWAYGSAESTATSVTRSVSEPAGDYYLGLFIVNTDGNRCAFFSVATGGATAPGPSG